MISFSGCVKYPSHVLLIAFLCHLCCENIRAHGERKSVHHVLHIVPINRPSQLIAIEVARGCKKNLNQANCLCTLELMCSSGGGKKFSSKVV